MRMGKRHALVFAAALSLALMGCAGTSSVAEGATGTLTRKAAAATEDAGAREAEDTSTEAKAEEGQVEMRLTIGDAEVAVTWEKNASVRALEEAVSAGPIVIEAHRYGGFEQVGPLGISLPTDDRQITTASGDVVLYQGNQVSVFYGENSWAYTRLAHITDPDAAGLEALLGAKDQKITISAIG